MQPDIICTGKCEFTIFLWIHCSGHELIFNEALNGLKAVVSCEILPASHKASQNTSKPLPYFANLFFEVRKHAVESFLLRKLCYVGQFEGFYPPFIPSLKKAWGFLA